MSESKLDPGSDPYIHARDVIFELKGMYEQARAARDRADKAAMLSDQDVEARTEDEAVRLGNRYAGAVGMAASLMHVRPGDLRRKVEREAKVRSNPYSDPDVFAVSVWRRSDLADVVRCELGDEHATEENVEAVLLDVEPILADALAMKGWDVIRVAVQTAGLDG